MDVITEIADAVVAELNAATLSLPFTAVRYFEPVFELPEMKVLHVSVVPNDEETQNIRRRQKRHDYRIDVAVQKKFDTKEPVELDPLMKLTKEIAELFCPRRLAAMPAAVAVKAVNDPIYDPEHMEKYRQFTSLVTVTVRIYG